MLQHNDDPPSVGVASSSETTSTAFLAGRLPPLAAAMPMSLGSSSSADGLISCSFVSPRSVIFFWIFRFVSPRPGNQDAHDFRSIAVAPDEEEDRAALTELLVFKHVTAAAAHNSMARANGRMSCGGCRMHVSSTMSTLLYACYVREVLYRGLERGHSSPYEDSNEDILYENRFLRSLLYVVHFFPAVER